MLLMIFAFFFFVHFLIGVYDFSFYRIPNLFLGILIVLYGIYALIYLDLNTILNALIVFVIVSILSFSLYIVKVIGAADAKYLAIASLWFGLHGVMLFLFLISLAGGVLALIYLLFRDHMGYLSDCMWMKIQKAEGRYPKLQNVWAGSGAGPEIGKRKNISLHMIPYGIAIAVGSVIMLLITLPDLPLKI